MTRFKAFNPDAFPPGQTEVWYWRQEFGRDMMFGAEFLRKFGKMPTVAALGKTHVLLGTVPIDEPERIFFTMQGEHWSPNGEAWDLIEASGTAHTSMSVGDIVKLPDG